MKSTKLTLTFYIAFCFVVLSITASAQAPNWSWANGAGEPSEDKSQTVTTDGSGNVIIGGYYNAGGITFGSTTLATFGANDVYVTKYDAAGNVLWAKGAGGTYDDEVTSVCTDINGNIYVTGNYYSPTITFGSTTLTNSGSYDIFIVKYDASGNVLWAKGAGGAFNDIAYSIILDNLGNFWIAGLFQSFSITFGSTTLTNSATGYSEIYIAKFDASGNSVWAASYGGAADDVASSLSHDSNDNIYMTGNFYSSSIIFGTTTLNNPNFGFGNLFITKFDNSGNVLWAKRGGGNGFLYPAGIATDASGNSYITGNFQSTMTFGSVSISSAGLDDIFLVKYDNAGTALWAKSKGGSAADDGYAVAVDGIGNCYITGVFSSSSITFGTTTLTNAGNNYNDIYITKYDGAGNVIWAKRAGGIYDDYGWAITSDASGNTIYISGFYNGPTCVFSTITLTNAASGTNDVYLAKLFSTAGIENFNNATPLSIFPNPGNGIFTIDAKFTEGKISIYNSIGNLIYHSEVNQKDGERINISNQPNGIYLVKIMTGNAYYSATFTKQ